MLASTPFHQALQLPPLNLSSSRSLGWPQQLAETYIIELRELVRLDSVVAQLLKHRRSPLLCEGPRGPMVGLILRNADRFSQRAFAAHC